MNQAARETLAAAIGWEQAHVSFETAVADVPPGARGRRADGYPHSVWELVEHIRLAQADLVAFMAGPAYVAPDWPAGYWPDDPEPPTAEAWAESLAAVRADRDLLRAVATRDGLDLSSEIPWGTGQTYLRTLLLAVDHTAYHVGQIVAVRRLLGAWA
jgi:uncharacterized damage-inducible protein DinB